MRTLKLFRIISIVALALFSGNLSQVLAQAVSPVVVSRDVGASAVAADKPRAENAELAAIENKVDAGDFKAANNLASTYVKSNPNDARAHFLLGQVLFKMNRFAQSKTALKEAIKVASVQHLSNVCVAANDLLIKLPRELSAPRQKYSVAKIRGRKVAAAGFARPRLLSFYAAWAEPCKQLSLDLDKVHTEYGEQLEIVRVDVDDPSNQKVMDQYDISPVPTVVFLDADGKVTNYFVGYDSATELNSSVKKALNKN
jgi:thioredoxin 1